jgi:hypothetical protein
LTFEIIVSYNSREKIKNLEMLSFLAVCGKTQFRRSLRGPRT